MFTVNRKEFSALIDTCSKVAPKRASYPVLEYVQISVKNNILTVTATDLSIWYQGSMSVDCDDFSAIVQIKPLKDALKGKYQTIEIDISDGFTVNNGGFTSKVKTWLEDFIDMPLPAGNKNQIENFSDVAKISVFASDDVTRQVLTGVHCQFDSELTYYGATNGHYLNLKTVKGFSESEPLTIPAKAILIAAKTFGTSSVELEYDSENVLMTAGNHRFMSQLLEGQYPQLEQILKKDSFENAVTFNRKELLNILKPNKNAFSNNYQICKIVLKDSQATIANRDDTFTANCPVTLREKAEANFNVNVLYLIDILEYFSDETVTIQSDYSEKSGMLRIDQELSSAVVMKIHIRD